MTELFKPSLGWLPIETCPVDETSPVLIAGGPLQTDVCTFNWDGYPPIAARRVEKERWHMFLSEPEMSGVRHLFEAEISCYYSIWIVNPTHWMPLPEPPAS